MIMICDDDDSDDDDDDDDERDSDDDDNDDGCGSDDHDVYRMWCQCGDSAFDFVHLATCQLTIIGNI